MTLPRFVARLGPALGLWLGACGTASATMATRDAEAPSCERSDPTCQGAPPSYRASVSGILDAQCALPCHHPGSGLARTSLLTYEEVNAAYGAALGQVSACLMPPSGYTLSSADRATLLAWLACGAPDN